MRAILDVCCALRNAQLKTKGRPREPLVEKNRRKWMVHGAASVDFHQEHASLARLASGGDPA